MKTREWTLFAVVAALSLLGSCAGGPSGKDSPAFRFSPTVTMRVLSVEEGLPAWRGAAPVRGTFSVVRLEARYDGNYPEERLDLARLRLAVRVGEAEESVAPAYMADASSPSRDALPAGEAAIRLIRRYELAFDLPAGAVPLSISAGADAAALVPALP